MELNLRLNADYKSFDANFNYHLSGALIVISGVNGSGKSQLLEIIRQARDQQGVSLVNANITLDGKSISDKDCAFRSFKENISIPNFKYPGPDLIKHGKNKIWTLYSNNQLRPGHSALAKF